MLLKQALSLLLMFNHFAFQLVFNVGYYLNPEFYNPNAQQHSQAIDTELMVGLRQVLKKLLGADDQIKAIQKVSWWLRIWDLRSHMYMLRLEIDPLNMYGLLIYS